MFIVQHGIVVWHLLLTGHVLYCHSTSLKTNCNTYLLFNVSGWLPHLAWSQMAQVTTLQIINAPGWLMLMPAAAAVHLCCLCGWNLKSSSPSVAGIICTSLMGVQSMIHWLQFSGNSITVFTFYKSLIHSLHETSFIVISLVLYLLAVHMHYFNAM